MGNNIDPRILRFDYSDNFSYTKMLKDQADGKINSWAIRWHASSFLRGKISLYPGKSLIRHIGNDNSGTNACESEILDCEIADSPVEVSRISLEESHAALREIKLFFERNRRSFLDQNPQVLYLPSTLIDR